MRKIVFGMSAGFAGMDDTRLVIFDDNPTDAELHSIANDLANDFADMYGVEPYPDDYDEEDDDGTRYSDNIEGWWSEYSEEDHGPLEETRL